MKSTVQSNSVKDERLLFECDYSPEQIYKYDLCLSENPLSCSPSVIEALKHSLNDIYHYPDKNYNELTFEISNQKSISNKSIHIGAGVTEIIQNLVKILFTANSNIIMPEATFPGPAFGATSMGGYARRIGMNADLSINFHGLLSSINSDTKAVFVCNPNNPTGILEDPEEIISFAKHINVPLLVSEANIEYAGEESSLLNYDLPPNIIVLRSFSKAHGLASMRIGYAVCNLDIIKKLDTHIHPYRTSRLAEVAALAAIKDTEHIKRSALYMSTEIEHLRSGLEKLGYPCTPSKSNNIIASTALLWGTSTQLVQELRKKDCSALDCSGFGRLSGQYIRLSPRDRNTNNMFLSFMGQLK